MRINHQALVMVVLVSLLSSCGKKQTPVTIVANEFPINEILHGDRIDIECGAMVANIAEPAGDYYVFNASRGDFCFYVYNHDFQLVDTLVRKGRGHDEMLSIPLYLGQWRGDKGNPEILIYSGVEQKMVDLTVPEFKGLNTIVQLPKSLNLSPKYLYEYSDDKFYGFDLDVVEGGALFSYDKKTNELTKCPPPFEFADDSNCLFYITQQSMAIDKAGDRICAAYNSFPWLTIYDSEFNLIRKVAIGEEVDTRSVKMDDQFPGLTHVNFHRDYITVLYTPVDSSEQTLLKVFDKDGLPKASYAVGNAIWYFIDGTNSILLTMHYDDEEDLMYLMKYELPQGLK